MLLSAPRDFLRRHEAAHGLPQRLAAAVVAALVEGAVLARRVDPDDLVAAADEGVGPLLDDHAVDLFQPSVVIEKTGHAEETEALLDELKKIGIYEFVRSGRVAIAKPMERLNKYLKSLEEKAEKN